MRRPPFPQKNAPKPIFGWGRDPLKRRRTRESIPCTLRQELLRIFMNRFEKCRANFFVRFFMMGILLMGVSFVMVL